ncbi:MAG: 50S ribosomal protein L15 [Chitinispirillaceae bacterium]|nr:50S ribosomal protein L15 [Chitinispirillaceae bacterium]
MLKLNDIKPAQGSNRQRRRVGRGQGSGRGCTAGKGSNGHSSRSGSKTKPYFEGGQTPLTRRLPKRGFRQPFRNTYQVINLKELKGFETSNKEITAETLCEAGLIQDASKPVKVLGVGDVTKPLVVRANSFSRSARKKIEQAKGKAEVKARV